MKIALLTAAGLYLAFVLLLFAGQRALIYPAPKGPATVPAGFEKVSLETADGLTLVAAWRAPAPGKRTILFFHGNGDSLPGAAMATRHLAASGYGVLLADYRGYAGNPGTPTEAGLLQDGRAAVDFLARRGTASDAVVLMGASLGSGVAARMAAEHAPAALVLVSPFTSLPDAGAAALPWVPVRTLMRDRFDNLGAITRVRAPVLVLHASDDRVIPFRQGAALVAAAPGGQLARFANNGHQLQFTAASQSAIAEWLAARGL
ncbi:alpha/beta hydrolase [Novosphingobium sp. P6W]|uniref:alpha/beta hydrolase n=1 Tax=Novosphingobium sp. P6W TaxID=1609758 RepID=UPI0005C2E45F|nr:alpha/beta fold hydrolase [Novosphingobium sp. P6W]AXB77903.1 alpha/beta hydrolase [Novosphingobium sp. P6W]KIS30475.1 hypothetical protein TQ38_22235 [Novosphingobium sp. P6W]